MSDQLREVAEAIVNLGFADEIRLAPFLKALRQRPVTDSTTDEEDEATQLLTTLETARVIDSAQRTKLEKILSGELTPRARARDAQDPFVGMLFGDFRAISKIGEGGMGAVYRAERLDDGSRDYVVKILSPLAADQATYVRFRREGEVMAALRHPNVVRVYTAGEVDGLSYLVMDFVDGSTLQELLERKQRFDWMNAAKAVRQVALGLEAAHAIGVIHRDIKPQNVLLSRNEGLLKVADFGLAKKNQEPSDPNVSRAGDILGSPAYIAPEQWGDHDVDQRADLFSVGVVLYQLLTGVLPFRAKTPHEYAKKILAGVYDPVSLYSPDVSEGMRHLVTRLLERRREDRYQSATALVLDLERCLRGDFPDVPRLVRNAGETIERYVLVGRDLFTIGRQPSASVVIDHPSVHERHAVLERTNVGLILREAEGKGFVRVNGMRVREIALKDNDVLEFGDAPPFRFRSGSSQVSSTPLPSVPSPSPLSSSGLSFLGPKDRTYAPPLAVPGPLFEAYLREEHPRAILAFVELLDDTTWFRRVVRGRRRLIAGGVSEEVTAKAAERALGSYRRLASVIPDRLFRVTKENLGSDPAAWLGWWFGKGRDLSPTQATPPGPRGKAALALAVPSETGASVVPLSTLECWVLGRGSDAEVRFSDRSVSRKHATIYRLLTRFAVRDEGSRFGTVLRAERKAVALLRHDDTIELGRAKALFRQPDELEVSAGDGPRGVDTAVFEALVELRSPHVAGALVAFTDPDSILRWALDACAAFGRLEDDVRAVLRPHLEERRRMALEALPAITRKGRSDDPRFWREWWAQERGSYPPQIVPEGWPAS